MHQNKGVSCLWTHIKTIQVELVGEFWETSKMIVSPRRNARFWFYAPESRVFRLWNHINQNPIGTNTSNIIHDIPLITKTPRPDKGRVPSYMYIYLCIYYTYIYTYYKYIYTYYAYIYIRIYYIIYILDIIHIYILYILCVYIYIDILCVYIYI